MKDNNLKHLKKFSAECDIFGRESATLAVQVGDILPILIISALGCLSKALIRPHPLPRRGPGRGLYYTYHINTMQTLKSTEPLNKSTEIFFAVDFKSTAKSHKSAKTRYQLISLSKKPKKINIDQL